jgi:hypothetical protein
VEGKSFYSLPCVSITAPRWAPQVNDLCRRLLECRHGRTLGLLTRPPLFVYGIEALPDPLQIGQGSFPGLFKPDGGIAAQPNVAPLAVYRDPLVPAFLTAGVDPER